MHYPTRKESYKDLLLPFEIAAVVIAVVTLILIYLQLLQLREQNNILIQQTRASVSATLHNHLQNMNKLLLVDKELMDSVGIARREDLLGYIVLADFNNLHYLKEKKLIESEDWTNTKMEDFMKDVLKNNWVRCAWEQQKNANIHHNGRSPGFVTWLQNTYSNHDKENYKEFNKSTCFK